MSEALAVGRQGLETRFHCAWKRIVSHHTGSEPRSNSEKQWAAIVPPTFFDYDLTDGERIVFIVLDMFARMDTFCFPSYRKVAAILNRDERSVRRTVKKLAEKGVVKTVHVAGKNSKRVGVILLKRVNPSTPAADTPAKVDAAENALLGRQRRAPDTICMRSEQFRSTDVSPHRPEHLYRFSSESERTPEPETSSSTHEFIGDKRGEPGTMTVGQRIAEVGRLATALHKMPWVSKNGKDGCNNPKARTMAEQLAEHIGVLLEDPVEWRKKLCEPGWWLHGKEVTPGEVDLVLRETLQEMPRGTLESPGASFCNKLDEMRRIVGEETGRPVDYPEYDDEPWVN